MSVFRKYSQAGGAIHDLEHIAGLSAERTIPLLLSERVLYVLQNLANQDVAFECRWAVERQQAGYLRLTTDDAEYSLFVDVVSEVGYQLRERQAGMGTLQNYRESLLIQTSDDNAGAGTNLLSIQGPGTDEVWILDHIVAFNETTGAPVLIVVYVSNGSVGQEIARKQSPPAGEPVLCENVRLSNDLSLLAYFFNCVAGDNIRLVVSGYIMDLIG